jgi:hypothetical protein
MPNYVFFNRNTGDIIHTHEEVSLTGESLSIPTEELRTGALLKLLADRLDTDDIEVLEVTENAHLLRRASSADDETQPYVDVKQGVLSSKRMGRKR